MAIRPLSHYIDDPAALLIPSLVSVMSQTTVDGAATGLTLVDAALIGQPSMEGQCLIIIDGGAAGQSRSIVTHTLGTGTLTVEALRPFTNAAGLAQTILAGTRYVIMPFPISLAALVAIVASLLHEQADVPVSVNATNAAETDVLNLAVANTRYVVRSLRLKCADPGVNTVTVRLYELVNDVLLQVDSFDITAANFATFHSVMDLFGLPHLAGDRLRVTVRASAGGPYIVTAQYVMATATV